MWRACRFSEAAAMTIANNTTGWLHSVAFANVSMRGPTEFDPTRPEFSNTSGRYMGQRRADLGRIWPMLWRCNNQQGLGAASTRLGLCPTRCCHAMC